MGIPNENASFHPDTLRPKGGSRRPRRGGSRCTRRGGTRPPRRGGTRCTRRGVRGYPREGHQSHPWSHKMAQTQRSIGASTKFGNKGRTGLAKACLRTVRGPAVTLGSALKINKINKNETQHETAPSPGALTVAGNTREKQPAGPNEP